MSINKIINLIKKKLKIKSSYQKRKKLQITQHSKKISREKYSSKNYLETTVYFLFNININKIKTIKNANKQNQGRKNKQKKNPQSAQGQRSENFLEKK